MKKFASLTEYLLSTLMSVILGKLIEINAVKGGSVRSRSKQHWFLASVGTLAPGKTRCRDYGLK